MARKHQFDSPVNALAAYLLTALLISLATPVSATDAPFPVETQVWVVAHRPGHSQGLQLSRVNGHWGISVVQQWWLNFEELQVVRTTAPDAYAESLQNLYARYPVCTNPPADSQ